MVTNFTLLTTEQKTVWSRDLWRYARNQSFIAQFLGDGPNATIQHIKELTKTEKGARAVMTLVPDLEGDGVVGDNTLKGREEQIKAYDLVVRIDQMRNANKSKGRMADQKTIVKFRETSRDVLSYWLGDRIDQLAILTLSGVAYSLKNDGASRVGSEFPQLEFAADVTAPSAGRRLRWDATAGALVASGATSAVTATDTPSWKMLVQAKAYAKTNYIRGIRKGGQETYDVIMHPNAMAKLKQDADYLAAVRHAQERGDKNPLFTGAVPTIDGLRIHEHRHVFNTLGTATKWGSGNNVEGNAVLFLGAQSMGMADLGDPMWDEEEDDYGNNQGIAIGKILGFLKPQYITQYGATGVAGTKQDFGSLVIYTAM